MFECCKCHHKFRDKEAICEDWRIPEKKFICPCCHTPLETQADRLKKMTFKNQMAYMFSFNQMKPYYFVLLVILIASYLSTSSVMFYSILGIVMVGLFAFGVHKQKPLVTFELHPPNKSKHSDAVNGTGV